MTTSNIIPASVETKIYCAVTGLLIMREAIAQGEALDKTFSGNGRYTADVIKNRWGTTLNFFETRDGHVAVIKKFQQLAIVNGVNLDGILDGMGYEASLEVLSLPSEVWDWM